METGLVSHSQVSGGDCGHIKEIFQQHSRPGAILPDLRWCLQCLAGIGLAQRQHSAVPLVVSVFFPNEGADHSLFNCSNEFSKLVAEEYLSFFDFTGLTLDKALR